MGKTEIIKALNAGLAKELASAVHYTNHCRAAEAAGLTEEADVLRRAAADEIRHADRIAERVVQLSGRPTADPAFRQELKDPRQMIRDDLRRKQEATEDYRILIRICIEHVDPVTRLMLEEILTQEERHAYEFGKLLSDSQPGNGALKTWEENRDQVLGEAVAVS
jgi:bacterioferritin